MFRVWCCDVPLDPYTCPLPRLFEFLDSLLVKGLAPSTIRVYASAISVHRDEDAEKVLSSPAGKRYFRGLARSRPPTQLAPPSWDLSSVLRTLCQPPFEPLAQADDRALSLKTAFLLAVCTGLRVSDMSHSPG